jgi:hypothetical protein
VILHFVVRFLERRRRHMEELEKGVPEATSVPGEPELKPEEMEGVTGGTGGGGNGPVGPHH